ncbi:unnamed protein product [Paramecium primaurelia]|uniref:BRCA2 OB1 domain-containing protein n=1 Tax=Paramecium primaurelia TaxID=5886 RepID=A0A8S1LCM2_PARPR|nr:unnamed protein product [Paramecium primaurelia]
MEQCQDRMILELSDGWYSLFYIFEQSYEQIYKKIKIGQKLHVTNLKEYPIIFNTSNVKIITQYPFTKLLVTTKINSIKKAKINSKLGRQQQKYFIRSIKSLRNGTIPCIDVFIVSKSYLINVNQKNQRKALLFNSETENEEEMQQLRNSKLCFFITVMDSLNNFNERQCQIKEFKDIIVYINDPLQYETICVGQRVQIINASNSIKKQVQNQLNHQDFNMNYKNIKIIKINCNQQIIDMKCRLKQIITLNLNYQMQLKTSMIKIKILKQKYKIIFLVIFQNINK